MAALDPPQIARRISSLDPAFRPLIRRAGPPPRRRPIPVDARFATLCEAVTSQLLSTKAADTIHARVVELCDGDVTPERILDVGHGALRGTGLSNAKAAAMIDLAARTLDGRLRLHHHGRLRDEEVLADVVAVRGLGPWSAQMYLMFSLARPDVWSPGDYGVRKGWTLIHELDELISERELRALGDRFAGVRSAVAWYCWRAIEGVSAK